MIRRLLIANRGEIARRIIRTAKRLSITTIVVHSDVDANAWFVEEADVAVSLGGSTAVESYLDIDKVLEAAQRTQADAIHPGYGFLSENSRFARRCDEAGLRFVGPSADVMDQLGAKDDAKALAKQAGVPVVPGYQGDAQDDDTLIEAAKEIGFPLLIKATAGGGGKGMRRVETLADMPELLGSARREAASAFGNDRVILEKLIERPRHIEVQVLGDGHGNAVHLYERDCSAQRRHQKVIEEAPAANLDDSVRRAMGEAAVSLTKQAGYQGAGTVEFLLGSDDAFYFIEMNTRLQVEHPVSECITGLDLVEWQLRVAAGEALPWKQSEIPRSGHAVEVRLYAEDPSNEFLPAAGAIRALKFANATRVETGVREGDEVSIYYDPMIAKVITHAADRQTAIDAMRQSLAGTLVGGLTTNLTFLEKLLQNAAYLDATLDTTYIDRHLEELVETTVGEESALWTAGATLFLLWQETEARARTATSADVWSPWADADGWRPGRPGRRRFNLDFGAGPVSFEATGFDGRYRITTEANTVDVSASLVDESTLAITRDGVTEQFRCVARAPYFVVSHKARGIRFEYQDPYRFEQEQEGSGNTVLAPMPGKVLSVNVSVGDTVKADQTLIVMEAMKMELTLKAPRAGEVAELGVKADDLVTGDQTLVTLAGDAD